MPSSITRRGLRSTRSKTFETIDLKYEMEGDREKVLNLWILQTRDGDDLTSASMKYGWPQQAHEAAGIACNRQKEHINVLHSCLASFWHTLYA